MEEDKKMVERTDMEAAKVGPNRVDGRRRAGRHKHRAARCMRQESLRKKNEESEEVAGRRAAAAKRPGVGMERDT